MTAALRRPTVLTGAAALLGFVLVLALRFVAAGAEMDEGAVLSYAVQILHGRVPMRDFQTFYGPGNPWLVALVFKLTGPSFYAERAVGFAYRIVLAVALFALVRRRGRIAVAATGLLLALVLPGQGTWAWASYGALACAVAGVALARERRAFLAGLAFGLAVLMRFDWILAVAGAAAPFLVGVSWRVRRRGLAGFAVGAGAYVPFLLVVGHAKVSLLLEQLRATEPARRLPLPQWSYYPGYLLALDVVAVALLLVVGARRREREFLSVGLLGAALLPSVLARADGAHVVVAAVAPLALLPAVVPVAWREVRGVLSRVRLSLRLLVAGAAVALAIYVAAPFVQGHRWDPMLRLDDFPSYTVSNDGREFRVANDYFAQTAAQSVRRVDRLARPGQRVFVGPLDLRRTNYADTYLYYLLPRLRPASFYMELNPKTANEPASGLARQLGRADFLILTSVYDVWGEPNSSRDFGSTAPNTIVRREFCERGHYGFYRVLQRCHAA